MEHEHTVEAIHDRLVAGRRETYLRDWIFGGIDGTVTTFAAVSGVVGAGLGADVILVIGLANLLADGFSMAASNYLGTKAEWDDSARLEAIEHRHIAAVPEGEREEVRQIFASEGFAGDDLDRAVEIVTSDRARWVRFMLAEEYGLPRTMRSPLVAALTTYSAFVVCGAVPLAPFVLGASSAFELSTVMAAAVFFAVGSLKGHWSLAPWWRSGLETLALGSIAAALAYAVGLLVRGFLL
jgi:VIT1/CCC1 family predicted Fe2+/Mn2+ transporter